MASLPRLRWQNSAVNRVLQATCSRCSLPATRSPVSSACTSSASLSAARAAAVNGASPAAARAVQAATVPTDIGVPNNSASSAAVRSTGRCWPKTRYTAIAAACGPYCTGADTPAGPAAGGTAPQAQRGGGNPAGAGGGAQPVLDPPDGDRGDVEPLPPDDPGRRTVDRQLHAATGA